jgi:MFS family permease
MKMVANQAIASSRTDDSAAAPHYRWVLLAMLLPATVFEGYDITIFHLCMPDLAATFHLNDAMLGSIATIVRFGGILSFFVVILADHYGRKPILGVTVAAYAACTALTAIAAGPVSFTLFQCVAQVFLAAEFGIAITIISEEFPDEQRGRAVSLLLTAAFFGVAIAGMIYGPMVASRWGWRGMYIVGVAPLLLIAWIRRRMRETTRFSARLEHSRHQGGPKGYFAPLRTCLASTGGPWRGRLILIAMLCSCIGLVGGPTISFFSLYARRDHGWTAAHAGIAFVVAYFMGSCGSLVSGYLLDRLGRRGTAVLFFVGAAVADVTLFQSSRERAIFLALSATMFSYQGARTAISALGAELFPTGSRATGFSLSVQVFGQIGWTLAPLCIGLLSGPMRGIGNAATLFAAGPIVGAIIATILVPETRGRTLEELSPAVQQ